MKKYLLFTLFLALVVAACEKTTEIDPLPQSQRHLMNRKIDFIKLRSDAPNDIRKDEIQKEFDQWLESYLRDSLNGKIENFVLNVRDITTREFADTPYVYVEFSTEDGLKINAAEVAKNGEIEQTKLYQKVKDVNTKQKIVLSGTIVELQDYDPFEFTESKLKYKQIEVTIDTVYNKN